MNQQIAHLAIDIPAVSASNYIIYIIMAAAIPIRTHLLGGKQKKHRPPNGIGKGAGRAVAAFLKLTYR
jgi:hypothetical protein